MRAVTRAPHSRDKNSLFQALLSLPGWEGKVTPEPSHPPPGETCQGERVGNEQVCAMERLSSITPHSREVLGLLPWQHRAHPLPGRTGGSARAAPTGEVNPGLQDTSSKANIQQHCGSESKSHPPQIFAPSAAPTSCLPSTGCLGRVQKNTDTKLGSQGLKGLCFVPLS